MNIIKLKDVMLDVTEVFFNTKLRGRYAYWIRNRYIVPFDAITTQDYVSLEQEEKAIESVQHIDMRTRSQELMNSIIDFEETNRINSIETYKLANEYCPDNLTGEDLAVFRSWLAGELLRLDEIADKHYMPNVVTMLKYYKDNMYDDIVETLSGVVEKEPVVDVRMGLNPPITVGRMSCGCNTPQLDPAIISMFQSTCDPVALYKDYIYKIMVENFSNVDFWAVLPKPFLKMVKAYVDDIIKAGYPLASKAKCNAFSMCDGGIGKGEHEKNTSILKAFSDVLDKLIADEVSGNYLLIKDTLHNWSANVYELMYWK